MVYETTCYIPWGFCWPQKLLAGVVHFMMVQFHHRHSYTNNNVLICNLFHIQFYHCNSMCKLLITCIFFREPNHPQSSQLNQSESSQVEPSQSSQYLLSSQHPGNEYYTQRQLLQER